MLFFDAEPSNRFLIDYGKVAAISIFWRPSPGDIGSDLANGGFYPAYWKLAHSFAPGAAASASCQP
jgi:hypothetical protein